VFLYYYLPTLNDLFFSSRFKMNVFLYFGIVLIIGKAEEGRLRHDSSS
jgi:hypothetical protein